MPFQHVEHEQPQFTPQQRRATVRGWMEKAKQWRYDATHSFGLSPEHRQILLSNARAAEVHALRWAEQTRQARKAS